MLLSRLSLQRRHYLQVWRYFGTKSTRSVQARGIDYHVEICNAEAPLPVLCLPGALGTARTDFEHQLDGSLGDEFQVVALDPRGLGGSSSTKTERDYPPDFYLRDAVDGATVMSALGHTKYFVLGWSDGAISAIHLAANQDTKHNVRALAIWGGNSYMTQEDIHAYEAVRDVGSWSERMREDKSKVHGGLGRLQQLNHACTDAWRDMYFERGGDVCLGELHEITCPTLVLHGAKDPICDIKHPQYIARQIANATITILPDGKHNIHQRQADSFNAIVRSFFLDTAKEETTTLAHEEEPAIDEIAYAFMGSKALFSAIRAGVFDAISQAASGNLSGTAPFEQVEANCDVKGERLRTLLSACVALKLIRRQIVNGADAFFLPKASADQLVRSSKRYWGDYISGQVDAQFYDRMSDLDNVMRTGKEASHGYESWFESDPDAARRYTEAQHNGSLATAYALHKRRPELAEQFPNMRLLDVGGGSGAFSIATARKIPSSTAVVLDLPNVVKVAEDIIAAEKDTSVRERVSTLPLSATAPGEWQGVVDDESFDVVLLSYVSGSIPAVALPGLYENAYRALKPGGRAIIHDFFVENKGTGPTSAALWALAHVTVNPEGMGLRPNRIVGLLRDVGFVGPKVDDLIPGATQLIVATKPI